MGEAALRMHNLGHSQRPAVFEGGEGKRGLPSKTQGSLPVIPCAYMRI